MTFILNEVDSIANNMLKELRDKSIQQDRMRFRQNVERLGSILAYEVSKKLSYHEEQVETPLGFSAINVLRHQPVLITVLRAGLPFFQGFQYFFDQADNGFIGAYRKESETNIAINLEYLAAPDLAGKHLILIDPMLATGKSVVKSVEALLTHGTPAYVHIAALVAAPEGIEYIKSKLHLPYSVYTCALDEKLNTQSYIVPGLGDAGDLCYGEKL
ncbi:MAG: uracil phosphoribosyltransferase [Cyclobacteriaceae bacterium]|nr:uracil phosphoribosyltransferase [Cyclobacteriaceae bacterium]